MSTTDEFASAVDIVKSTVKSLEIEREALNRAITLAKDSLSSLNKVLDDKKENLDKLNVRYAETQKAIAGDEERWAKDKKESDSQLQRDKLEFAGKKNILEAAFSKRDTLITTKEVELVEFKETLADKERYVLERDRQLDTLQDNLVNQGENLNAQVLTIEEFRQEVAKREFVVVEKEKSLRGLEKSLEPRLNKAKELEKGNETDKQLIDARKLSISKYETELERRKALLDRREYAMKEKERDIVKKEAQLNDREDSLRLTLRNLNT